MERNSANRWLVQAFSSVALAIGLAGAEPSGAQSPSANITVMVFAGDYVVAGRAFDNLNVLESELEAIRVRAVNLHACGPNTTRSLMAAFHRFRQVPVQIRVFDAEEPECRNPVRFALTVEVGDPKRPFGIDDEAVDLFWREAMP